MPQPLDATGFLPANTTLIRPPLTPGIALHLASDPYGIFLAAERIGAARPYWAFAWAGGQALARHILDNPAEVAGRRVLDLGAGSGLIAIAAMQAGAASAVAADTDPLAAIAAAANARANAVTLSTTTDDLLATAPAADLVVIGDLFYEPELVTRVTAFLHMAALAGTPVLFADRTTARRPRLRLDLVVEHCAPLTPDLDIAYVDHARVWRLVSDSRST